MIIYRGFGPNILESSQGARPIIEVPRLSLIILILESTPWQVINKYIKILRYILITKTIDFITLIKLIFEGVILKFRVLNRIISNRGSIFTSIF